MPSTGGPPTFLPKMQAIAAAVRADRIDDEMGEMCQKSLFFEHHRGSRVSQERVDRAEHAFSTITDRLMPAPLIHEFVLHACATRVPVEIEHAELAPGFTDDEALAAQDAAARLAIPMKKFTRAEVLACVRWNAAEPLVAVGIAHMVALVHVFAEGMCALVAERSPEAAQKLGAFASQWAPKNVLKFLNAAIFVVGGGRAVDQPLLDEAMNLLNRSGAFQWTEARATAPLHIHCPAQSFLHKLVVNEGTLLAVIGHVAAEAAREPNDASLAASIAFVRQVAATEEQGIRTFGQEWSKMKNA
jgi:hypothetical protein